MELLTGRLLLDSDCIYLGHWMICYPTNEFWAWIYVVYACRMSFKVLLLRGFDKIALALYEYKINKHFTPLLYVKGKWPVWSEYTFPESTTAINTIWVFELLVSIVIETCVDLTFYFLGSSYPVLCPLTLVNIYARSFMLILDMIGKTHCLLPLSMWMEQGWRTHNVGTVSGLGVMKSDVNYWFFLSMPVLMIPLDVQWV